MSVSGVSGVSVWWSLSIGRPVVYYVLRTVWKMVVAYPWALAGRDVRPAVYLLISSLFLAWQAKAGKASTGSTDGS